MSDFMYACCCGALTAVGGIAQRDNDGFSNVHRPTGSNPSPFSLALNRALAGALAPPHPAAEGGSISMDRFPQPPLDPSCGRRFRSRSTPRRDCRTPDPVSRRISIAGITRVRTSAKPLPRHRRLGSCVYRPRQRTVRAPPHAPRTAVAIAPYSLLRSAEAAANDTISRGPQRDDESRTQSRTRTRSDHRSRARRPG